MIYWLKLLFWINRLLLCDFSSKRRYFLSFFFDPGVILEITSRFTGLYPIIVKNSFLNSHNYYFNEITCPPQAAIFKTLTLYASVLDSWCLFQAILHLILISITSRYNKQNSECFPRSGNQEYRWLPAALSLNTFVITATEQFYQIISAL